MDARLPDAFLEYVVQLLPPQVSPGSQGGRPPIKHVVALRVIWFVLTVGCRWRDVPKELGCSGETARTRLREWKHAGIWKLVHERILAELNKRESLQLETVDTPRIHTHNIHKHTLTSISWRSLRLVA